MAARTNSRGRRRPARARARRTTRASLQRSITRIEEELPATLAQFSRRMRTRLGTLEKRLEKAGAVYRRRGTRLLREASHQLGRFEAEGELRWKRLTTRARREALHILRRLERELGPPGRGEKAARRVRKAARSVVANVRREVEQPRRTSAARKRTTAAPAAPAQLEALGSGV